MNFYIFISLLFYASNNYLPRYANGLESFNGFKSVLFILKKLAVLTHKP